MIEITGAIHMHSVFSDGSGEVEDIARYAGEAGLDYILLTDHNLYQLQILCNKMLTEHLFHRRGM